MLEWIVSGVLLFGAFFMLVGSIGLLRLPDFYSRLHAPTKATTLGVASMLIASVLYLAGRGHGSAHEILVLLFLFISAPVSAYMLVKAALHVAGATKEGADPGASAQVRESKPR
jgi:multicomponent K+:H+ antiporter subunit G